MQRAYRVLINVFILLSQVFAVSAVGYEFEGKVYKFRSQDQGMDLPSSKSNRVTETRLDMNNEEQMLKQLEDQGYVFKPLRKRKTLEDPPVTENSQRPYPGQKYPNCPAPEQFATQPRMTPSQPVNPYMPGMATQPPLGYPYTYPSPQHFPYPGTGYMPFPGGFGIPRW